MTAPPTDGDPAFADLLDELLDELLNGDEPDLAAVAAKHPDAAHRIDEAYKLACGVAGRRVTTTPSLAGYQIVRELGRGGMGTVYLARQEQLDREVALKVLPHTFGLSAASRQRFLEEARALARVHHDHIVGIHRIVDDGDLLAFEMEFVDGPSLQAVLTHLREVREAGKEAPSLRHVAELLQLPVAALGAHSLTQFFVNIALRIARALGAVHAAGFVHRDVKPANILLHKDGKPVLADFGLVRDTALERSHKTGFAGTPVYSSPEQLRGNAPVGAPTDVYALAITLYECLTLSPPFHGRTTTDMLQRIESGRVPPLRRQAPQAPRDLETIVAHAMELEPERRYESGTALADDLQRLLDLQPIRARPVGIARRIGKFARRNRMSILAASMGALVVAAAMWPLLDQVHANDRARASAREHLTAARQALLSPAGIRAGTGRSYSGARVILSTSNGRSTVAAIEEAIEKYRHALDLWPDSPNARRELAIASMLRWQRGLVLANPDSLREALATADYKALRRALPPLTGQAAELALTGEPWPGDLEAELETSGVEDRTSLGLLAFLLGELHWSELAWGSLPPDTPELPLRDAVLGLLHLADGAPQLAYVRLLAAQRELPETAFALELADAALGMGETGVAEQWLARAPESKDNENQRQRILADLAVARGDDTAAGAIYRDLLERDFLDPLPWHRLAQLAMRDGDLARAESLLDELLARWPAVARFRLDRARVALQRRDAAGYLQQVVAVLLLDPTEQTSGGAADLLEILRIGGLKHLHANTLALSRGGRSGRTFLGGEMPLRSMVAEETADRVELLLPLLADIEREARRIRGEDSGLGSGPRHVLLTLPLAFGRLPALTATLSPLERLALEALPWVGIRIYPRLQPYMRVLHIMTSPLRWSVVPMQHVTPPDLRDEHAFGSTVLRGADWNDDGVDDVLVACEAVDPTAASGSVLIVDGRTADTIGTVEAAPTPHMFGHSLAVIGDIDGDGHDDWLVGAPAGSQDTKDGYVELRSGRDRALIARIRENAAAFGVAVAGTGDIDDDGCPDFAVSVPPFVRNATAQGYVVLFSGRTRERLRVLQNDRAGTWFGGSIADAGDTDGDGRRDLIVGGNFGGAPGLVRLYSGASGEVLQSWTDESTTSCFGCVVTGPGDLDGDGCGDIVVSAIRQNELGGKDQVHVYSGRTGRPIVSFEGECPGSRFGASVVAFPVRGRARPLVAIGESAGGSGSSGAVELWTLDGLPVTSLIGPAAFASFGGAIAVTNDTDGDGKPELFVASPVRGRNGTVARIESSSLRFSQ